MQYLEFTFNTLPANEAVHDVLSAMLADIGFDSFVHTNELDRPVTERAANPEAPEMAELTDAGQFHCYIQKALYDEEALREVVEQFPLPEVTISYDMVDAED